MKKALVMLMIGLTAFVACKKEKKFDAAAQAAADDAAIQAYIQANNLTNVTKDASGLYYQVITPGTGSYPSSTSTVSVNYSGKLLNGTVFDSGNLSNTALAGLINGWQIGIPHINTGGRILLLVPSALGYGNNDNGSIPANSVLIFTIDLLGYK